MNSNEWDCWVGFFSGAFVSQGGYVGILVLGCRDTERFFWEWMKRPPACFAMNLKPMASV